MSSSPPPAQIINQPPPPPPLVNVGTALDAEKRAQAQATADQLKLTGAASQQNRRGSQYLTQNLAPGAPLYTGQTLGNAYTP